MVAVGAAQVMEDGEPEVSRVVTGLNSGDRDLRAGALVARAEDGDREDGERAAHGDRNENLSSTHG
jgi:hypothetical protein